MIELYPEIQEMAMPIHMFLMSDSVDKLLKDGMLAADSTNVSTFKMLELVETTVGTSFLTFSQFVPLFNSASHS